MKEWSQTLGSEGKTKKKGGKPTGLAAYRDKRSAERSPEPFGAPPAAGSGLFVVQKHWARQKHFDLRLEIGGVLHSWAVPKGPSLDPQEKRLAMEVEDHPLEYADFEGTIPEGNYGAGAVIVFDQGRWVSLGEPAEGLRDGKLLFDLWGHKLKGRFTLFRTKGGAPNAWLLMKKPDAFAAAGLEPAPESIFSGLTVEALREGKDPAAVLRATLAKIRADEGDVGARDVAPMLAGTAERPFSGKEWIFELKYDGYRMIAAREPQGAFLRWRGGQEVTDRFPELAAAVRALPYRGVVLDGELVVLDSAGKPSFALLQQRVHLSRRHEVARARTQKPATLFVFDLLAVEGYDTRSLPLHRRKSLLRGILPPVGPLRYAEHFERDGEAMFEEVERLGFEGIVAKRADSPYRGERSQAWLKIKADKTAEFVIVGRTRPQGGRSGFGALHLGVHDGRGALIYAGRVGTGFNDRQLDELSEALDAIRRPTPAFAGDAPAGDEHVWVEPRLVCEVRYKEWTAAGQLRHPVFLRLRDDRRVLECTLPGAERREADPPAEPALRVERDVAFSNLKKVFWPEQGYTKGDLVDYYRAVSPWLLPYLKDRPVVLTRYPDGIAGKSFYQKDAPSFVPDWLRTETMWSEHAEREIRYFVCDDVESLLYVANMGTIPLHLWSSRVASLQHPDWCILDLDPKGAPFRDVVKIARALHVLCEEIELASFVKTSGSSGLHVLLPLGRECTYEQSRALARLLATIVARELPEIATLTRPVARRGDRVYIDYLQNGHGRLLVAPYSVRPLPGAPVSATLAWSEVNAKLDISRHTIRTLPPRLDKRPDPWAGLLDQTPDLHGALERLMARLERS